MNLIRSSLAELRRLTTGTLPKLAILAFMALPMLYSGLYLYANYDPYARLDQIPAALVVQDDGERGQQVADELMTDGGFTWTQTSADNAYAGVKDGSIDAALIIGPTFTADLESSAELDSSPKPRQASLTLVTNDANNFMIRTFADSIIGKVKTSIGEQVGTQAAEQFLAGFSDIRTSLNDAVAGTAQLGEGVATLSTGIDQLHDGSQQLASGADSAAAGAEALASGAADLGTGAQKLVQGTASANAGAQELAGGLEQLTAQTPQLTQGTEKLAQGSAQVAGGLAHVNELAQRVGNGGHEIASDLASYKEELEQRLSKAGLTADQISEIMTGLDGLGEVNSQALAELDSAVAKVSELSDGASAVAQGAQDLDGSAQALSAAISSAANGADQLRTGVASLNSGAGDLAQGAETLTTGAETLARGTQGLAQGATELNTGLGQAQDGTADLAGGVQELGGALSGGVAEIPNLTGAQESDVAQNISNPVAVVSQPMSKAGNYGAGLAPFFISISAWIGSLTMFLLIKPFSKRALATSRNTRVSNWKIALSGWIVPAVVGVFQMVIMFTVIKYAVGITPDNALGTGLFLLLISATFIALVQMLNAWLGTAGQLAAMVLMLLQLVTAGGTFPWQTIPDPIQWLHRILPMSYTIDGLRNLMYGGDMGRVLLDVAVLLAMFGGALFMTSRAVKKRRVWTAEDLQPQLVL